jgi:transposase-like protein
MSSVEYAYAIPLQDRPASIDDHLTWAERDRGWRARIGVSMSTSKGPGRARRKFTPEFKAEVVAMVEASGGKIAQVAREMKLHDSSVGNWVREAREAKEGTAPSATERAEIRELKAELERVTRERDILGKAVAYFSASHPKNV